MQCPQKDYAPDTAGGYAAQPKHVGKLDLRIVTIMAALALACVAGAPAQADVIYLACGPSGAPGDFLMIDNGPSPQMVAWTKTHPEHQTLAQLRFTDNTYRGYMEGVSPLIVIVDRKKGTLIIDPVSDTDSKHIITEPCTKTDAPAPAANRF